MVARLGHFVLGGQVDPQLDPVEQAALHDEAEAFEEHLFECAECARRLLAMGCEYVLITGTHENTPQVINTLYGSEGVVRADAWERLPGSYHGSGCTLASAMSSTKRNSRRGATSAW